MRSTGGGVRSMTGLSVGTVGAAGRTTRSRHAGVVVPRLIVDGDGGGVDGDGGGGVKSGFVVRPGVFRSTRPLSGLSPRAGTRPSSVPGVPGDGTPDGVGVGGGAAIPPRLGTTTVPPLRTIRSRIVLGSSGSRRKNGVRSAAGPEPSLPVPPPIPRRAMALIAAAGSLISEREKRAGVALTMAMPLLGSRSSRWRITSVVIAA